MEPPIIVENRAGLPEAEFRKLAEPLGRQRSIKHALDWLVAHDPPLTFADVVAQDEFSHDILVEYLDCLWLAYDTS